MAAQKNEQPSGEGDTLFFYTKSVTSRFGHMVESSTGRGWNTHSGNEVFQLTCPRYDSPLFDLNEYQSGLRMSACLCFVLSLLSVLPILFTARTHSISLLS